MWEIKQSYKTETKQNKSRNRNRKKSNQKANFTRFPSSFHKHVLALLHQTQDTYQTLFQRKPLTEIEMKIHRLRRND